EVRHQRGGFVKSEGGAVDIDVEGDAQALDQFTVDLTWQPPRLSQIDDIRWFDQAPRGEHDFRIEPSETDASCPIFIQPDLATCADCLAELFDPRERRYRYPFVNCTQCGPRLTIIRQVPYDRQRTAMADFAMCPA